MVVSASYVHELRGDKTKTTPSLFSPWQAYGEAVCSVLSFLADKALDASGHVWRRAVYQEEEAAEEAEPVDDCDMADIADEAEVEEEEEQDFADLNKVLE